MFDNVLCRAFGLVGIFFLVSEMTSGICENISTLFRWKENHSLLSQDWGQVVFQQEVYLKTHWNVRNNKEPKEQNCVIEKNGEELESHKVRTTTEDKSIKRNRP